MIVVPVRAGLGAVPSCSGREVPRHLPIQVHQRCSNRQQLQVSIEFYSSASWLQAGPCLSSILSGSGS